MPTPSQKEWLLRFVNKAVYCKFKLKSLQYQKEDSICRSVCNYSIPGGYERIYFFHIRKTAGTSLNNMICHYSSGDASLFDRLSKKQNHRLIAGNGRIYVGWNQHLLEQENYYYGFSHIPKHFLKLPDKTFTITILRDPASRVISHYKMLLEQSRNKRWRPVHLLHYFNEQKWLGRSFSDFLDNIPRTHLLNQLYTFSSRYDIDEAYDNILKCSYFFFTEDFDSGVANLSKILQFDMPKIMYKRKSTSKIQLSSHEVTRLMCLLENEYLLIDRLKKVYSATREVVH